MNKTKMKMMTETLLGAHTSTSGGLHQALLEGQAIGASTIQFFTSNQKQWQGRSISAADLDVWYQTLAETGLKQLMSHDSYLINLGSPNPETLGKSREAFKKEIQRCLQLGVTYLNFHPGAAVGSDTQQCLDVIVESLLLMQPLLEGKHLRLLLETTAGQGTAVGYRFEHLAYILNKLHNKVPLGVCIDTCHIFVAGYDIRTLEGWEKTLNEFDQTIGLSHLYAFHLNDSMKEYGSRVDRHQFIGQGYIGWECFKFLMNDKRTRHLPKYLETPGEPAQFAEEIIKLKECIHAHKN
jgi:deoxyribonuclease-4